MPELLLEIFCEEIPARMQARAADDLARLLGDGLKEAGFGFGAVRSFAGPRRLVAVIDDLPAKAADVREQRKGPRVGAPEKAIAGFLRGAGLESVAQCETKEDKKGAYYVAVLDRKGQSAAEACAHIVPDLMRAFPWPKSMKWGAGDFRWVRPLHGILCQLDGKRVNFEVAGVRTGDTVYGHRVMGPGPFAVSGFADYQKTLHDKGHVMVDAAARRALICDQIAALCETHKLELVENQALLDEVTGLAEWPVALLGDMDEGFLALPPEVIQLSMARHQKYFAVSDPKTGVLAPYFIVIANLAAPDGGKAIVAGNERVLSARLNDARYFWETDLKTPLEARVEKLRDVVFHQKLGSVYDKMERVAALARELAPAVGADPDLAERAARLAKADLTTDMVVEFPALQGVMGRYYALAEAPPPSLRDTSPVHGGGKKTGAGNPPPFTGEVAAQPTEGALAALPAADRAQIADAIRDHYKPQGPSDSVPTDPVSVTVALADKLDTLLEFWAINEEPTGSKDPYALRRAALGVTRLLLDNKIKLKLPKFLWFELNNRMDQKHLSSMDLERNEFIKNAEKYIIGKQFLEIKSMVSNNKYDIEDWVFRAIGKYSSVLADELYSFILSRLIINLRSHGVRYDLLNSVTAHSADGIFFDDLVSIVDRVKALGDFLDTADGEALLAGARRASNIVRIEEKKDGAAIAGAPDAALFAQDEEKALFAALRTAQKQADKAVQNEDYTKAMAALAPLRPVVDAFFDEVTVNAGDAALRANRLKLLNMFRQSLRPLADFDKIAG